MADVTRQGTALLVRWQELGNWAVKTKHGAAAVLAIMFALCLQRPVTAHPSCVEYAGPRIWLVKTPYGTQTQRVSLFDDDLMCALLKKKWLMLALLLGIIPLNNYFVAFCMLMIWRCSRTYGAINVWRSMPKLCSRRILD